MSYFPSWRPATGSVVMPDEKLPAGASVTLGLQHEQGLIAAGRPANFVLWPVRHAAELAYWFGHKPDCTVVRQGVIAQSSAKA